MKDAKVAEKADVTSALHEAQIFYMKKIEKENLQRVTRLRKMRRNNTFTGFGLVGTVLGICACMIVGVASFPAGWDSEAVRSVCGPEADDYDIGQCGVRWAYILATIGIFDACILAALAFLLATRYVKITPAEPPPLLHNGSIYKGEVNSAFLGDTQSVASRKSLALQPVMLMPQPRDPERISEFSQRTGRSKASHYTSSVHNFQL